jgi:carbon storage regulator CsrA
MLVLSRGRNDKVVFPTLGISVEILRVAGNKVRLGIDAPQEIPVHRHEVSERIAAGEGFAGGVSDPRPREVIKLPATTDAMSRKLNHAIRNRLNAAALGLHMLHRKLDGDDFTDAEATIFKIFNELKAIEDELAESSFDAVNAVSCDQSPDRAALGAGSGDLRTTEVHHELHHRALVVEDNDNERELLAGYLRVSGFEVDTATDGLQAMVRLTEKSPPDVVLLDMRMPRFDGSRTISAIRNNPDYRGLKLFAVSGVRPEEVNVSLGPNGVDKWFVKPIDPQSLLDAMREAVESEGVLA